MSKLSKGQVGLHSGESVIVKGRGGYDEPSVLLPIVFAAAPGAVGTFVFVAPRACRIIYGNEVHDVAGAGASVVSLRKHVAGQTAAANAATSGTDIVTVATDIAADATVRVPQTLTITASNASLAAGDKLAVVTPATWKGSLTLWLVYP